MFYNFKSIFNPTKEERNEQIRFLNNLRKASYTKIGEDCVNCKYSKHVQQSPYYDYTTCKFDESIELPGGLNHRHRCEKWEFEGFMPEVE